MRKKELPTSEESSIRSGSFSTTVRLIPKGVITREKSILLSYFSELSSVNKGDIFGLAKKGRFRKVGTYRKEVGIEDYTFEERLDSITLKLKGGRRLNLSLFHYMGSVNINGTYTESKNKRPIRLDNVSLTGRLFQS